MSRPNSSAREKFFKAIREAFSGEKIGPAYGVKIPPAVQREVER